MARRMSCVINGLEEIVYYGKLDSLKNWISRQPSNDYLRKFSCKTSFRLWKMEMETAECALLVSQCIDIALYGFSCTS